MNLKIILCFALALTSWCSAYGSMVELPVTPKSLDQGQFVFSVSTRPTLVGLAFHVTITAKTGDIPPDSDASLNVITVSANGARASGAVKNLPEVTVQKDGPTWKADFVASGGLLKNPDIYFVFGVMAHAMIDGKSVPMPSADLYEIRLHDFLTP